MNSDASNHELIKIDDKKVFAVIFWNVFGCTEMVRSLDGNALILALPGIKNDVSYCFTRCATHFPPGAHNLYKNLA